MWIRTTHHTWHGFEIQIYPGCLLCHPFSAFLQYLWVGGWCVFSHFSQLKILFPTRGYVQEKDSPISVPYYAQAREVWLLFQLTIVAPTLRFISSHNTLAGCFISTLIKDCGLALSSHCIFNIQIFYFPALELFLYVFRSVVYVSVLPYDLSKKDVFPNQSNLSS